MRRLTREQAIEIRQLYESSPLSLTAIATKVGVSTGTIQAYSRHQGWRPRRSGKSPDGLRPMRWLGQPCTGLVECPARAALIARAWGAAHVQITEIEMRMLALTSDAERVTSVTEDAKAVATLVRTLKDLTALDRAEAGGGKAAQQGALDGPDANAPRTDLADELARRLAGLRKRGPIAGPSGGS